MLTEEEFITLPLGDAEDDEQKKADKLWQEERRKEFNNQIDSNHDGKVTLEELLVRHTVHIYIQEIKILKLFTHPGYHREGK